MHRGSDLHEDNSHEEYLFKGRTENDVGVIDWSQIASSMTGVERLVRLLREVSGSRSPAPKIENRELDSNRCHPGLRACPYVPTSTRDNWRPSGSWPIYFAIYSKTHMRFRRQVMTSQGIEGKGATEMKSYSTFGDKEVLTLHQLRLLEWMHAATSKRTSMSEPLSESANRTSVPELWNLTEGVEPYPWQLECRAKWHRKGTGDR